MITVGGKPIGPASNDPDCCCKPPCCQELPKSILASLYYCGLFDLTLVEVDPDDLPPDIRGWEGKATVPTYGTEIEMRLRCGTGFGGTSTLEWCSNNCAVELDTICGWDDPLGAWAPVEHPSCPESPFGDFEVAPPGECSVPEGDCVEPFEGIFTGVPPAAGAMHISGPPISAPPRRGPARQPKRKVKAHRTVSQSNSTGDDKDIPTALLDWRRELGGGRRDFPRLTHHVGGNLDRILAWVGYPGYG